MSNAEKKLCRTCEVYDEETMAFVSLRCELVSSLTVADALMACAPIEISDTDGLPQQICRRCLDSLEAAYSFQTQCVLMQQKLKQIMITTREQSSDHNPVKEELTEVIIKEESDNFFDNNVCIEGFNDDEKPDFKCAKCNEEFKIRDDFTKHLETHSKSSLFCDVCQKQFTKLSRFERHLSVHHKKFSNEEALKHMEVHPEQVKIELEEGFQCSECSQVFEKQKQLKTHMKKHKRGKTNVYSCDCCDLEFQSKARLTIHKKNHNAELSNINDKSSGGCDGVKKNGGYGKNVCPYCNKTFGQLCNLKDHIRTHTGETPFLCSECGKAFNNNSNLRQHLIRHRGEKPYMCTLCPKKFCSKGQLKSHTDTHNELHPYVCDACGSSFTKPNSLKKHKLLHLGLRPFQCDKCQRSFTCKDHLKRHYRIHTGEKPYRCPICGRAFTQSNDLIKHKRVHVGQNIYQCTACPEKFRLLSELKKHYPSHYVDGRPPENTIDLDTLKVTKTVTDKTTDQVDTKPNVAEYSVTVSDLDVIDVKPINKRNSSVDADEMKDVKVGASVNYVKSDKLKTIPSYSLAVTSNNVGKIADKATISDPSSVILFKVNRDHLERCANPSEI